MIRAGSLIYAIVIALIMAILTSSLILLSFNIHKEIEFEIISERQITNVKSALNFYLTTPDLQFENNRISIDLFENHEDSVDIEKGFWGLYELIHCKAHKGNKKAIANYLLGEKRPDSLVALYLSDQNKPLALCGNTLIKGETFLPAQGVKRAYIENQNFTMTKLVDGAVQKSTPDLPTFSKMIMSQCSAIFERDKSDDSVLILSESDFKQNFVNSFSNPTVVLKCIGDLVLENTQVSGNIVLRCLGQLTVKPSAHIDGVLIIAKSIVIEPNCKLTFQGFVSDSIIVGQETHLNYPSGLYIINRQGMNSVSKISLGKNCQIKGNIINFNSQPLINKLSSLSIEEGVNIIGLVYSNGYTSLRGNISGSLFCQGFLLRTHSALYENHLLNVQINADALPSFFVGTVSPFSNKRKALINILE